MANVFSATREDVFDEINAYIKTPESVKLITKAADYAEKQHEGQFRKSGEPYVSHLYNVAYILATLRVGPETIAAGLLHDTIEDTGISKEDLAQEFNGEIAEMVEAVTKVGALQFKGKDDPEYQAANHRKLFIAMASDVRVILVKLADRLHNMRTLSYQSEESQLRIAAETMDVYAPIAHRLGISAIKNELEDLSFMYLNRDEYYHIAHLVESKKTERDESVQNMIKKITALLEENGLGFRIFGRSKHLYSIYHKMNTKHKRFDEILDLLAIRIVTKTKLNCYEILGYIHAEFTPLPGRLKDYIAVPKTNLYQSLHTTIIGDDEKIFEIQIRTEEMDEVAERGVAAHWRYKEGSKYDTHARQKEIEERLSWFRDFSQYNDEDTESGNASELMSTLKHDVFEANVYVMTPKGRVIDLPSGSTPIDFAYRVHTEVGHTTVGAIVNGAMVPLNTELHTGDIIQIKTQKGTGPSEDWLKFVKSNQARNKIRAYLTKKETEKKSEHVDQGEKILSDELKRRGFNADEYMDKKKIENIMKEFGVYNYIDLMYGLTVKSISPLAVIEKLTNQRRSINEIDMNKLVKHPQNRTNVSKVGLVIPGIESMKMSLAQCCLPVFGDDVVGYITKGEGVKVHRRDCANVQNQKARLIDVQWETEQSEHLYDANLVIVAHDRSFLFTDIVTVASQNKTPIVEVKANTNRETLMATVKLRIQVKDIDQLQTLMSNIRKVESVVMVERTSQ